MWCHECSSEEGGIDTSESSGMLRSDEKQLKVCSSSLLSKLMGRVDKFYPPKKYVNFENETSSYSILNLI